MRDAARARGSEASAAEIVRAPVLAPHVVAALELQAAAGNRALARALQRQETAPVRVPRRLERQDVEIESVGDPLLGPLGTYRWRVRFRLPRATTEAGHVIQEVQIHQEGLLGGGSVDQHYWESWPVAAGADAPWPDADWHDSYGILRPNPQPGTRGANRHVGTVKFYEGPLPPEFPPAPADRTNYTETRPSTWDGTGTRHDLLTEWDDRPGHPHYNRLRAYRGTEEIRIESETSWIGR